MLFSYLFFENVWWRKESVPILKNCPDLKKGFYLSRKKQEQRKKR